MQNVPQIVDVHIEPRPGGGIRVSSKDVPGLIISGKRADVIVRKLSQIIAELFQHKGMNVTVAHETRPDPPLWVVTAHLPQHLKYIVNRQP